ncbi:hypothetical protein Tco_0771466 [Tanacetum coccineum]|uniref:Uncharacterized protein n=1 Tax=Tanacetum coccineum TaxID=301880 RepID=A0ABQ4ZFD4_9ASTR
MVVTWCGGSEVVLAGAGGGDGNDDVGMVEVARWQSHWRGLRLELCTACGEYQCVVCWTAEMRRRGWNRDGDAAAKAKCALSLSKHWKELKTMFEEQAKQELFEIVKAFHTCKQEEGQLLSFKDEQLFGHTGTPRLSNVK